MEIVFFAILATFLFIRLWSVLGSGFDEKITRDKDSLKDGNNNDIFSNKKSDILFESLSPIERIRTFDPSFFESDFLESVKKAFIMITIAYRKNDKETLEKLLDDNFYKGLAKNLAQNDSLKDLGSESIANVNAYVQNVEFDDKTTTGKISVTISSIQDSEQVMDFWIFSKEFKKTDSYWRLSSIKSIDNY